MACARLLEILQRDGSALDVQALAHEVDLHPNTVREYLDLLLAQGLVVRIRQPSQGRGRPAWTYRADDVRREPDARVREHAALAGALAAHIAVTSDRPEAEGREAGERWGATLAAGRSGSARAAVTEVLEDLDFSPRAEGRKVILQSCPLLDVAQAHPEVVCAVHEGMVVGLLDALGMPHDVSLQPFGARDGCVLRLVRRSGDQSRRG